MEEIIEKAAHAIQRAYFKTNGLDEVRLEEDFRLNERVYLQMAWASMNVFRQESDTIFK